MIACFKSNNYLKNPLSFCLPRRLLPEQEKEQQGCLMLNIKIKLTNQALAEKLCDAFKLPFIQCSIVFDLNFVTFKEDNNLFIIEENDFQWFSQNYKYLQPENICGILIVKSLGNKQLEGDMRGGNRLKVHYLNSDKEENEIIQDIFAFLVQQIDFSKIDPIQYKFVPVFKGSIDGLPFTKLIPFLSQKRFSGFLTIFPDRSDPLLLPIKHGQLATNGYYQDITVEHLERLRKGNYILFQEIIRPEKEGMITANENSTVKGDIEREAEDKGIINKNLLDQISLEDIFQDLFSFLYQIFNQYLDEQVLDDLIENKFSEYRDLFMDFNFLDFDRSSYQKFVFKTIHNMEDVDLLMLFFKDLFEELIAHAPSFNPKEFVFKVEELLPYLQKYHLFDKIKDVILDPFSMS